MGEFLEKSSEEREYIKRTESPAPSKMTPRFVVRAVVRMTGMRKRGQFSMKTFQRGISPLPEVLNSDHLCIFSPCRKEEGETPSWKGPA